MQDKAEHLGKSEVIQQPLIVLELLVFNLSSERQTLKGGADSARNQKKVKRPPAPLQGKLFV